MIFKNNDGIGPVNSLMYVMFFNIFVSNADSYSQI